MIVFRRDLTITPLLAASHPLVSLTLTFQVSDLYPEVDH